MKKHGRIYIATSGWHYAHWIGPFYPAGLSKSRLLEHYIKHFNSVELNNSFYRLPETETFERWRELVPPDFIFSVKASRLITHSKKLKDPVAPLNNLLERAGALGEKLGPILFQLPPGWRLNAERLRGFLEALPEGRRYAFEFRNPSWFDKAVYDLLKEHHCAFCIYEFDYLLSPREVTTDFVYIRLHGPTGKYRGQYTDEVLSDWAGFVKGRAKESLDVYCYFDNDEAGYAALDAMRLKSMVEGRTKERRAA